MTTISDRIGSRKIPLLAAFCAAIIGTGLMSITHSGYVWLLAILVGLLFPMSSALFTTVCIETKGVGANYAGTAVSLMLATTAGGKTLFPIIGNSLATISGTVSWPFILWAFLAVIGLCLLLFVKETGWRGEQKGRERV